MRLFNKLKLAQKFGFSFGVVLALMLTLGFCAFRGFALLSQKFETFRVNAVPGQASSSRVDDTVMKSYIKFNAAIAKGSYTAAEPTINEYRESLKDAVASFDAYGKTIFESQEKQKFAAFKDVWKHYTETVDAYLVKFKAGKSPRELNAEYLATNKAFDACDDATDDLCVQNENDALELVRESVAAVASTKQTMAFTLAFALLVGVVFAIKLTKAITGPISQVGQRLESVATKCAVWLGEGANALANGDLTYRITPATTPVENLSQDEVGDMGRNFNLMLSSLKHTIEDFNRANDNLSSLVGQVGSSSKTVAESSGNLAVVGKQISAGADQIACGSQALATSATEAAAIVEQIGAGANQIAQGSMSLANSATEAAAIVEELQAQVNEVSQSSEQQAMTVTQASMSLDKAVAGIQKVDEAAKDMSRSAGNGSKAVSDTVLSMGRLKAEIELSTQKVMELNEAGEKIGSIVSTIDTIAGQTNLLALNAAIEAARAGEHGRGFAVVADEVRKLAEQSSLATKEISTLIQSVREIVQETVESISTTAVNAEDGVQKSNLAGQALEEILESVETVVSFAKEVEHVTAEATKSMQNVAQSAEYNLSSAKEMQIGTQKVSRAITDVASVSEESAACAEELNQGIQRVSRAITDVASVSEESAACAEELNRGIQDLTVSVSELNNLATDLKSQVHQFKVEQTPQKTETVYIRAA